MQSNIAKSFVGQKILFLMLASFCACQKVKLFVEKELILELGATSAETEWIVETQKDRILLFTFQQDGRDLLNEKLVQSSLTISEITEDREIDLIFPVSNAGVDVIEKGDGLLSKPFYSKGHAVLIRFKPALLAKSPFSSAKLNLKIEKAVECPMSLPGSGSSCERIFDLRSCYCGVFTPTKTWSDMRTYCINNFMQFVAIESFEEDLAVWKNFGQNQGTWIGASDIANEGTFVWDATGRPMSPGYTNWSPGDPDNLNNQDCAHYFFSFSWHDTDCNLLLSGICELQP